MVVNASYLEQMSGFVCGKSIKNVMTALIVSAELFAKKTSRPVHVNLNVLLAYLTNIAIAGRIILKQMP